MSTNDYLLYTGLFVAILATQLGTRRPDLKRLLLPLAIVAGLGAKYLKALPTGTTSHLLEAAGIAAGLVFGLAAVAFIRVGKDPADGRLTTTAGWAYATTWLAALALRLGFAYGSTHWFAAPLDTFSRTHHVTATTYAAAFVLMVLTMIAVRTAAVLMRGKAAGAAIPTGNIRLARRFTA
jgi:hypothetical protein